MIVPASRLLVLTASALIPASLLIAVAPGFLPIWGIALLGVALVAVLDMQSGRSALASITVEYPDELAIAQDRQSPLTLSLENPVAHAQALRLGMQFPPSFDVEQEILSFIAPAEARLEEVTWNFTPSERGEYGVMQLHMEGYSRMGLWLVRRNIPLQLPIHVYPNLSEERRQLAAIFLNRGRLGIHAQRQIGKGREFEQLREYQVGDSYEDIHWKATARRGFPVSKVYQLEKTQEVYVAIDCSRLSGRQVHGIEGKDTEAQLDRLIRAAMALGLVAEKQGDLFGLITFSDQMHSFVKARNGRDHFQACRNALYRLQPQQVNPDYEEVTAGIMQRLRRRALIIFLTNLDDPILSEQFEEQAQLLSRRHLLMVNALIPSNAKPLYTDSPATSVEDMYAQLAGHLQWHDLETLKKALHREGVTLHLPRYATLVPDLVSQYIDVKQRQLI